ncbi:MAG: hypothetical protein ACJAXT_001266 [Paracoccaceae bacterium]
MQVNAATCFLLFVKIAVLYSAATALRRILVMPPMPATIALFLIDIGQAPHAPTHEKRPCFAARPF